MTKEEIKTKWLEELRYGGHEQVQGTLKGIKSDGKIGYCCLGVLADKVMGLEVRIAYEDDPDEGDTKIYNEVNNLLGRHFSYQCSDKNDEGWTFVEIADYIEREWVV